MAKTDINKILKDGARTKVETIDYSAPSKKKELAEIKDKSDRALRNKYVSQHRLSKLIINL